MQEYIPQIITAILGVLATLLIARFPEFASQIRVIADNLGIIVVGLIGAITWQQNSVRQEQTKVEVAQIQAQTALSVRNTGRE